VFKKKLTDLSGDKLRFFHLVNNRGHLVYSANLELGEAVAAAFEAMSSEVEFAEKQLSPYVRTSVMLPRTPHLPQVSFHHRRLWKHS